MAIKLVDDAPTNGNQLAEIYSKGIQYALASKNKDGSISMATPWVLCKDFLNDAYWGHINKKSCGIYGFLYDPAVNKPLDLTAVRLMVRSKTTTDNRKFVEQARMSRLFLGKIDTLAGFNPASMGVVSEHPGVVLFELDGQWAHALPLLSLATCLLRIGLEYDGKMEVLKYLQTLVPGNNSTQQQTNDPTYIKPGLNNGMLESLIKNNVLWFAEKQENNFPSAASVGTIHNSGVNRWLNMKTSKGSPPPGLEPSWGTEMRTVTEKVVAKVTKKVVAKKVTPKKRVISKKSVLSKKKPARKSSRKTRKKAVVSRKKTAVK